MDSNINFSMYSESLEVPGADSFLIAHPTTTSAVHSPQWSVTLRLYNRECLAGGGVDEVPAVLGILSINNAIRSAVAQSFVFNCEPFYLQRTQKSERGRAFILLLLGIRLLTSAIGSGQTALTVLVCKQCEQRRDPVYFEFELPLPLTWCQVMAGECVKILPLNANSGPVGHRL